MERSKVSIIHLRFYYYISTTIPTLNNMDLNSPALSFKFQKIDLLKEEESKFERACNQIRLLNEKIDQLNQRYCMAKSEEFRCFRYNFRLRIAVIEGTRNMYYEYARQKVELIAIMRKELFNQSVVIVSGSDDSNSDSEAGGVADEEL